MNDARRIPLPQSRAVHPSGARQRTEAPDPDERIQVTVVVRSRTRRDERRELVQKLATQLPQDREHFDLETFVERFGATDEDLGQVVSFAEAGQLQAMETNPARRCVVLTGRIADVDEAFGVTSALYDHPEGVYRSHEEAVHLPATVADIIEGVLGLDDRQVVTQHLAAEASLHFTDRETVMEAYGFPTDADGTGERVGIVALGGGFRATDLTGSTQVEAVELDGQRNDPADLECVEALWQEMKKSYEASPDASSSASPAAEGGSSESLPKRCLERVEIDRFKWTIEVSADVQHVAGFAPGAESRVYFAPNSMQGKYTALTTALCDEFDLSVISCSWGAHERGISKNHQWLLDDVFEFAALRGITICCSTGDDGDGSRPARDGLPAEQPSAHFPASSPHVLACGGTMWTKAASASGEVVWKEELGPAHLASGGGVSGTFGSPWWQPTSLVSEKANGLVGRGIPDVAGKADMRAGYRVTVGGIDMPIGGTSSVAPMWAGLIARLNQKLGVRVGYVTPLLYLYRDRFDPTTCTVTEGSNGAYRASPGWDACTGWGTPNGVALWESLSREPR